MPGLAGASRSRRMDTLQTLDLESLDLVTGGASQSWGKTIACGVGATVAGIPAAVAGLAVGGSGGELFFNSPNLGNFGAAAGAAAGLYVGAKLGCAGGKVVAEQFGIR